MLSSWFDLTISNEIAAGTTSIVDNSLMESIDQYTLQGINSIAIDEASLNAAADMEVPWFDSMDIDSNVNAFQQDLYENVSNAVERDGALFYEMDEDMFVDDINADVGEIENQVGAYGEDPTMLEDKQLDNNQSLFEPDAEEPLVEEPDHFEETPTPPVDESLEPSKPPVDTPSEEKLSEPSEPSVDTPPEEKLSEPSEPPEDILEEEKNIPEEEQPSENVSENDLLQLMSQYGLTMEDLETAANVVGQKGYEVTEKALGAKLLVRNIKNLVNLAKKMVNAGFKIGNQLYTLGKVIAILLAAKYGIEYVANKIAITLPSVYN
jgi:hypothetical protein